MSRELANKVGTAFDYDALPAEARVVVRQKTGEIQDRMGRAAQSILEIGERLTVVKEHLAHGQFARWLDGEFEWSEDTAQRMMRAAEFVKNRNLRDLKIAPSALYMLAAPSTPEPVREEVIKAARAGRKITHAEVKQATTRAKPAKAPKKPSAAAPNPQPPAAPPPEPEPPKYQTGRPIPAAGKVAEAFANASTRTDAALRLLTQFSVQINPLLGDANGTRPLPGGEMLAKHRQQGLADLKNLRNWLRDTRPFAACPYPHAPGAPCEACKGLGWVVRQTWDDAPAQYKAGGAGAKGVA